MPSVVIGLWGALTFGPFLAHHVTPWIASHAPDVPVLKELDMPHLVFETPLTLDAMSLIGPAAQVAGHPSGTSKDSEDTLNFSRITGVRPMIETMPLEKAAEAYEKMMSNDARFRMVLTTGN